MPTVEEWRQYFEMVNGREPSAEDLQHAIANGEVQASESSSLNNTTAPLVQPTPAQHAPAVTPTAQTQAAPAQPTQPTYEQPTQATSQAAPSPQPAQYAQPSISQEPYVQAPASQQPVTSATPPVQQPQQTYQAPSAATPIVVTVPATPEKKSNTLKIVIITVVAVFAVLFIIAGLTTDEDNTDASTACQSSMQSAQSDIETLSNSLDNIAVAYEHGYVPDAMKEDFSNARDFTENSTIASCDSDDTDELNSSTESNDELSKTSNEWLDAMQADFSEAF